MSDNTGGLRPLILIRSTSVCSHRLAKLLNQANRLDVYGLIRCRSRRAIHYCLHGGAAVCHPLPPRARLVPAGLVSTAIGAGPRALVTTAVLSLCTPDRSGVGHAGDGPSEDRVDVAGERTQTCRPSSPFIMVDTTTMATASTGSIPIKQLSLL